MTLNREWHASNRLGRGADREQRLRWHEEHARVCGCRPIPLSLRKDANRRPKTSRRE
jgi:hypothetical protein